MAALIATTPTNLGALIAGAAVSASDTIARGVMGPKGCYLEIINNNGASDTITFTDPGATPAGNPLTGGIITAGLSTAFAKIFHIKPEQVNPATQLVTITHSVTTNVTYKLYPVG